MDNDVPEAKSLRYWEKWYPLIGEQRMNFSIAQDTAWKWDNLPN
jgi:hypothetical protein